MKYLLLLALLPFTAAAADFECSGDTLIYGPVVGITVPEAIGKEAKTLLVRSGSAGNLQIEKAVFNPSIAGGESYQTATGVTVTVPAAAFASSRPEVTVWFSTYDYPYETARCRQR